MGACQNVCKQQQTEDEIRVQIKMKHKHKIESDLESKTDQLYSQSIQARTDSIADEMLPRTLQPQFLKDKTIHSLILKMDRKNRFQHDLEEEVKYIIKKIQKEEEDNLKRIQQQFEMELEKQRKELKEKEEKDRLNNQFSFQNSMKDDNGQASNPYLPKQTSQFAPKRNDNDTVSQKSQISKNTQPLKDQQVSPKGDALRKNAMKKIIQQREELASNNASNGTSKSKVSRQKQQLDAYEKLFSDYFSHEERSSGSRSKTQKSVKSILKKNKSMSQRSISMGKMSVKSTHTMFKKSKKVRFSNDTNFNNERKGVPKLKKSWWDW